MTESGAVPQGASAVVPPSADTRQVRAAAVVAGALVLVGCVLGLVWAWWCPPSSAGVRLPVGTEAYEDELFIGADGRFFVLTAAAGLIAGIVAWRLRRARGPWMVAALGIGGVAGALLTDLVGHLLQGASRPIPVGDGAVAFRHLALTVHATGLLLVEGAIAVLLYGVCVAFTAPDDLGRPDPVRDALRPARTETEPAGTGEPRPDPGEPEIAPGAQASVEPSR